MIRRILLAAAAAALCLAASAQYLPVLPNPYGERPVIVPVPTTVAGVSDPVIRLDEGWFRKESPAEDFVSAAARPAGFEPFTLVKPVWATRTPNAVVGFWRAVQIPERFAGQRIILRFAGTTHAASLWVNGRHVRDHWGSYTSWTADITDFVTPGQEARVALRLDERGTGLYMVEDAFAKGTLKPGGTIIEATAGNTGLGIAFAALNRGVRVIFVVPTKFSQEKQTLLRALGAELINTPREEGMLGAEKKAEELLKQIPDSISLRQFHNMANPRAHYETTGPEIYDDLDGNVDYVVAGAGSGGTFSGILKALKERNPKIQGVLADPVGSTMGGGEHGDYNIEGIGNDFIADTMDMSLVDRVIKINDDDAFSGSRELAQKEGIFAGSSSGGAFAAAKKLIASGARGNIVFVAPDRGDRYFSKELYK